MLDLEVLAVAVCGWHHTHNGTYTPCVQSRKEAAAIATYYESHVLPAGAYARQPMCTEYLLAVQATASDNAQPAYVLCCGPLPCSRAHVNPASHSKIVSV